ncbi:IS30 family transposase [Fructobacillus tropaeoli]|uniref:IS30 family transposase n=1 Tax=Fructobacillus tropaeoli TaxID=709323 RepID=UPI001942C981|nr:IS30 family transposase [Fructobacillus tropaeoli]GIC69380.1 IS30 family transposase [Fructobacillus tropaeoli]
MDCRHLTLEDRVKLETWIAEGYSLSQIATRLGFARSTITREIQRATKHQRMGLRLPANRAKTMYQALSAHQLAEYNKHSKIRLRPRKLSNHRASIIKKRILEDKWSPEQIVYGSRNFGVSARCIYNWINQNKIEGLSNKSLRLKGKRYKRALSQKIMRSLHQSNSDKRAVIQQHTIERRPLAIERREVFGHWELDGVESMQSSHLLLTFVERKTRYAEVVLVKNKYAYSISEAIEGFLKKYQGSVKSITCDRGTEFLATMTQRVFQKNNIKYYYAHAYSPHERGSNENFNRTLREYFPKKTDFAHISLVKLRKVVMSINTRPMALHGFKTRLSAFKRHLSYQRLHITGIT